MLPCTEIDPLIPVYLDAELVERDLHDFESHVADCADCEHLVRAERAFRRLLRHTLWVPVAPDSLRQRLALALDLDQSQDLTRRRWQLACAALVVAAGVAIAVAIASARDEVRIESQQFAARASSGTPVGAGAPVNSLRAAVRVLQIDAPLGQPRVAAREVFVIELDGRPAIIYRNSRGIATMFTGDMSLETLLRIVAGSGALD